MLQLLALSLVMPAAEAAAVKPIGTVELQGTVETPLYGALDPSDPSSFVEVKVGEEKLLLKVASGHYELQLTEAALGRIGAKASGKEGAKTAKVAELQIGGLKVTNATAHVGDPAGLGVDGQIGLPGLGVAWAVLPSKGVVKFATGPDAAALVSSIGKAGPLVSSDKTIKTTVGAEKVELLATGSGTVVNWSGVAIPTAFKIEEPTSWLARELEGEDWYTLKDGKAPVKLAEAPGRMDGAVRTEWREVSASGLAAWTEVQRRGQGPVWAAKDSLNATLGADVLARADFAADPTSDTASIATAATVTRGDWSATYEASLRKALEPAQPEGGEPMTAEAKAEARAGAAGPLADWLEGRGKFDEAISLRKEVTAANGDDCTSWLSLGSTLVAASRPGEAVEPLAKAAGLYAPWAALSLEERTEISEKKAAAEKKKEEWTGQSPQSHACHVANGLLAVAQVQNRNPGAVAELYPAQMDLDPTLAVAAGNAAMLQGKLDVAEAAYRRALTVSGGTNADARVGVYLATAPRSFASARLQIERADLTADPLLLRLYVEGVRAAEGADGVRKALDTLVAGRPGDGLLLAWRSHERTAAGDAAGAAQDLEASKARFAEQLASRPNDARLLAAWASALALTGDTAGAQAASMKALSLAPGDGVALLAAADVAAAAGDAAKAADNRKKAGVAMAANPAYALLLQ